MTEKLHQYKITGCKLCLSLCAFSVRPSVHPSVCRSVCVSLFLRVGELWGWGPMWVGACLCCSQGRKCARGFPYVQQRPVVCKQYTPRYRVRPTRDTEDKQKHNYGGCWSNRVQLWFQIVRGFGRNWTLASAMSFCPRMSHIKGVQLF